MGGAQQLDNNFNFDLQTPCKPTYSLETRPQTSPRGLCWYNYLVADNKILTQIAKLAINSTRYISCCMPTWTSKCAFAMPLNPPKKKSGKNNDCQLFSKGDLYSWQGRLNHENELKQGKYWLLIMEQQQMIRYLVTAAMYLTAGVWDILQATTQQKQLTALKLVCTCIYWYNQSASMDYFKLGVSSRHRGK